MKPRATVRRLQRASAWLVILALLGSCKAVLGIKDVSQGDCADDAECPSTGDACTATTCVDFRCVTSDICSAAICDSGFSQPSNPACATCDTDYCCAEWTTCNGDSVCATCATTSGATGCDTNTAFYAASACEGLHCGAACGLGGICATGYTSQDADCDACQSERCCAEWSACLADATCRQCGTECAQNSLYQVYDNCRSTHCSASCA